jgi:uncharacterized protein (DUF697 family)
MKVTPAITAQAKQVVREHMLLSAGSALIPEPILCTTAVTAAHLRMLAELSQLYKKPFNPKVAEVLLVAASGGALTYCVLGQPFVRRALATLGPVILPLWFLGGSVMAGTLTHFMGLAFIRHYESGGTYRTFDWEEFAREFEGKLGITRLRTTIDSCLKPA